MHWHEAIKIVVFRLNAHAVQLGAKIHDFVIPAQAGIQAAHPSSGNTRGPLDSRLRGNDD